MIDLNGKNVGVTGGTGFIGKHVCSVLESQKANVFKFEGIDLVERPPRYYLATNNIEYVIHLAGHNGGIEFNRLYPADVFYINTIMGLNIIRACVEAKVKKILSIITSCSYPASSDGVYLEEQLHNGPPDETVACHGYAKRNLEIASRVHKKQCGLNAIIACPSTVYGPGDRTDPNRTKVMTALIKKFVDAKRNNVPEVICWGSGSPKREFIYVTDVARLLIRTLAEYESDTVLNISTGQEYSIKELSELIAKKVDYTGDIVWDTTKSDGAMRKSLNVNKMKSLFGEYEFVPIEKGVENTVRWYCENCIS